VTILDSADWHRGAAAERGQPPEHAFTHIGLFLAWLVRNDLHDPAAIPPEIATRVMTGELNGSDLAETVGGRLSADALSPEGAEFAEWYYPRYLDDYQAAFAGQPEYSVTDGGDAYARIAPTIDRRYAEWIAASWGNEPSTLTFGADETVGMTTAELDSAARELAEEPGGGAIAATGAAEGAGSTRGADGDAGDEAAVPERHDAPDLEALLPPEIAGRALHIVSSRASDWQSSLLRRAIERVGADPAESFVVLGLGGVAEDAFAVTLYAIPGVDQQGLEREFSSDAYLASGQHWERRNVEGRTVWWSEATEFDTAFYAMGGLVVTVGGSPATVRTALEALP
jgi:hypothetical protein